MSFTIKVKEELIGLGKEEKTELSAIIKMSGSLGISSQGLTLSVITENAKIARHIYELLATFYQVKSDIRHHQKTNLRKNRVYTVFLDTNVEQILADLHLADSYLRGAFLSSGSMRDPESGKYQLEILSVYSDHAEDLAALMRKFLLDAKTIERKKGSVTYLQRAEDIMDFLIVIGAMKAMTEFESFKLVREARNDLNRTNNVETANIARTVTASMKTIHNISKIIDTIGLEGLPVDLQEVAYLRVNHPDYSIQQLADSLSKPLTKSGVNHRLRKINKIANEL